MFTKVTRKQSANTYIRYSKVQKQNNDIKERLIQKEASMKEQGNNNLDVRNRQQIVKQQT